MTPLASHGYTCHSYCRPSCEYTWRVDDGPWVAGQGNVIGVIPQHLDTAKTLMCRATNTVSGLFAAKIQDIAVSCKAGSPAMKQGLYPLHETGLVPPQ